MKLPADCLRRSTGLTFLLALFRQVLCKGCPPDATERAMQCVASFSGSSAPTAQANNILSDWDLKKISQACGNGTFSRGLQCAENIIKSCEDHAEQNEYLKKYFDIPRLKEGVHQVCTRTVNELANDAECIRKQKSFVKQCAEAETTEFQMKVKKIGQDMDKILEAACQVLGQVVKCQAGSVRRNCGERTADELSKALSYFDPPYCESSRTDEAGSGGDSRTNRSLATFAPCILFTVLRWLS